jgi:hypothetical protein
MLPLALGRLCTCKLTLSAYCRCAQLVGLNVSTAYSHCTVQHALPWSRCSYPNSHHYGSCGITNDASYAKSLLMAAASTVHQNLLLSQGCGNVDAHISIITAVACQLMTSKQVSSRSTTWKNSTIPKSHPSPHGYDPSHLLWFSVVCNSGAGI